ncbi:PPE family protein [Mycobacterium tuberculosis]|nr:PPE family protein [Mycobacterium tuberculosis]
MTAGVGNYVTDNPSNLGKYVTADTQVLNRPGMSGDSSSWKGWGHVRWFIEEVPAGAA